MSRAVAGAGRAELAPPPPGPILPAMLRFGIWLWHRWCRLLDDPRYVAEWERRPARPAAWARHRRR